MPAKACYIPPVDSCMITYGSLGYLRYKIACVNEISRLGFPSCCIIPKTVHISCLGKFYYLRVWGADGTIRGRLYFYRSHRGLNIFNMCSGKVLKFCAGKCGKWHFRAAISEISRGSMSPDPLALMLASTSSSNLKYLPMPLFEGMVACVVRLVFQMEHRRMG